MMFRYVLSIPLLFLLTANFTSNTGPNRVLLSSDRRAHPFRGAHVKYKGPGENGYSTKIRYNGKLGTYEELSKSSDQFSPNGMVHISKSTRNFYVYALPELGQNIYVTARQGYKEKEIIYGFLEVGRDKIMTWSPESCENAPGVVKTAEGDCIFSTESALIRAMIASYPKSGSFKSEYVRD